MVAPIRCPEFDEFRKLLKGAASREEAKRLEGHLLECGACQQKIKALGENGALRVPALFVPTPPAWADEAAEQMMGRMRPQRTYTVPAAEDTASPGGDADHSTQHGTFTLCRALFDPPKTVVELGWLGPYRILGVIGQGGMGTVFKAEDPRLGRLVAIKVPHSSKLHQADSTGRQRFLREARVAAPIRHPHVCPIHDVGEHHGFPYVVMTYLEGGSLAECLAKSGKFADCKAAAELTRQVATGLAALHEHNVIHRDLKPGNILIDGAGKAVLTDFGLARPDDDSDLTDEGEIMGTVSYMAPEQADDAESVGPAADIYSLGVVLYQMLTGRLPFRGRKVQILSKIAKDAPPPPSSFRSDLDPKLEAIVQKAMAREPAERYSNAAAMAGALENWLTGAGPTAPLKIPAKSSPTKAVAETSTKTSPAKSGQQPRKTLAIAASVLLLVGGIIVLRIATDRGKPALEKNGPEIQKELTHTPPPPSPAPKGLPLTTLALVAQPAPFEGVLGWTFEPPRRFGPIRAMAYSPNGHLLAATASSGRIHLWDVRTQKLQALLLGGDTSISRLAWSPDGRTLAAMEGRDDQRVWVWEVPSGKRVPATRLKHATALAWSPDSKTLAIGHTDGVVTRWTPAKNEFRPLRSPRDDAIRTLTWSPDGKMLAGSAANKWWLWNLESGSEPKQRELSKEVIRALAWSPGDGKLLAIGGADKKVHFWDRESDKAQTKFIQHQEPVVELAWSPSGKRLASFDRVEAVLWSCEHSDTVWRRNFRAESMAFCAEVDSMAFGLESGTVAFVQASTGTSLAQLPSQLMPNRVQAVAWSPDGAYLAGGGLDSGLIHIWDGKTGKSLKPLIHGLRRIYALAWSADGKTLAASSCLQGGLEVEVWDVPKAERLRTLPANTGGVVALAWSPKGKRLAIGGKDLSVFDFETEQSVSLNGVTGTVLSLAWSPNGYRLAAGHQEKTLCIWDVEGAALMQTERLGEPVTGLSWSADGVTLAIARNRKPVAVWKVDSEDKPREIPEVRAMTIAWSPEGVLLTDQGCLWRQSSHKVVGTLPGGACLAWHPDGKLATIASSDGTIRLWDAATGTPRATLLTLGDAGSLAISPEGNFRGAVGVAKNLHVIVESARGQELLTVEDFATRYRWKNEPERVWLTGK
ncbi:MAG: protein kinase [Planctomycetes bacterium]|nr:protein kinase [Planctomycetota bacterium]